MPSPETIPGGIVSSLIKIRTEFEECFLGISHGCITFPAHLIFVVNEAICTLSRFTQDIGHDCIVVINSLVIVSTIVRDSLRCDQWFLHVLSGDRTIASIAADNNCRRDCTLRTRLNGTAFNMVITN
jgi:hypothetical protein